MEIKSNIRFADEQVKKAFEKTKLDNVELYKLLLRAFEDIEQNAFCGIQIPKRQIPQEYEKSYHIKNLWKYNLPDAWRLLYSIENQQFCIVSIILEWMNHKDYERRLRY
ncbi:MAG: hypothetical protein AABW65_03365 [Nanoarchaeota archaeon]